MANKHTFVNTQVPVDLDTKLRQIAAEQRVSRSDIVRRALKMFIAMTGKDTERENLERSLEVDSK